MYKGLVDLKELRKNINNSDCRRINGYCFVIGNKIIKLYAKEGDNFFVPLDRSKICDFSKYKADTIVFPDTYIKENGEYAGEISDFINDESIMISFKYDTDINCLINSYELVLEDLLTYSNIVMKDLNACNILYSNDKGFHIIDTSEWRLGQNTYRINKFSFDNAIVKKIVEFIDIPVNYRGSYAVLDDSFVNNCDKFGKVGNDFIDIFEMNLNNKYRLIDLMYLYKELYEKYYGEQLRTLDDVKKYTKVLKKG